MSEGPKARPTIIHIRPGDRVPLLLLCLIFIAGFGGAYYAINEWKPSDTFERALKFLGQELSLTLLLFASLVIIRCFVSSERLEKALSSITWKVLIAMTLVACAITALLILVSLATS
jgi:NADH:ubiquinone oxidoreductase subunit H